MEITSKQYSLVVPSSFARDLIWVEAFVTISEESESNYLTISGMQNLVVENNFKLTDKEFEIFKIRVLDQYISDRKKLI